jgi:2-polyprenyl-3-methyl-5-hydroxy-6-metoxy-1,4-benzoquinol methylase
MLQMSNSNWKQYFDKKAQTHGASVKSSDYFDDASFFMQRNHILRWLGTLEGQEILDAGCGVGAFSEPLTASNTVYGVDFSEKSLEFAAARGLKTVPGDLTALDFAEGRFDVVFCIGVIQLIETYLPVINELARVTKPGGTLLVQTLHRGSLQRKMMGIIEQSRKFDRMYALDELETAFAQQGFEQISFLKMYHPFRFVTEGRVSALTDLLCTSFAIKGQKRFG